MSKEDAIQRMIQTIRDNYEPEKIILFGSRAWGQPTRESDGDVLIIKESDKREIERIRDVQRLIRQFQQRPHLLDIDILVKTPGEIQQRLDIGDDFIRRILDLGRVVYERSMV